MLANAAESSKQDPQFATAIDVLLQQAVLDAEERRVVESDRAGQTYAGALEGVRICDADVFLDKGWIP